MTASPFNQQIVNCPGALARQSLVPGEWRP